MVINGATCLIKWINHEWYTRGYCINQVDKRGWYPASWISRNENFHIIIMK